MKKSEIVPIETMGEVDIIFYIYYDKRRQECYYRILREKMKEFNEQFEKAREQPSSTTFPNIVVLIDLCKKYGVRIEKPQFDKISHLAVSIGISTTGAEGYRQCIVTEHEDTVDVM